MERVTKTMATSILEPYVTRIASTIASSVDEYLHGPDFAVSRSSQSKRTGASHRHDLIIDKLADEFSFDESVKPRRMNQLFTLEFESMLVLRFNQFNERHQARLNRNQQTLNYIFQQVDQLEFDGMPPNGLLFVGYTLDKLEADIAAIYIVCRDGAMNLWEWDITDFASPSSSTPTLVPPTPTPPIEQGLSRKVRGKANSLKDVSK